MVLDKQSLFLLRRKFYAMHRRCYNRKDKDFVSYGGRGILVCKRWENNKEGFKNFVADMGMCPKGKSLERMNNSEDYSPKNCIWATAKRQARNTRRNRMLTYKGETHCMSEWAEIKGMSQETLLLRLKAGWSLEKALIKPVNKDLILMFRGERKTIKEWAEIIGIDYSTLRSRIIDLHWSPEKALTKPVQKQRKKK